MAVPALRVLEDREGGNGKKIKKHVKGSIIFKGTGSANIEADDGSIDVIDKRGFVDGVKVARKCSKAVEYIRVLKKREYRLKVEQAGLKTLISGLVGRPALVREWEMEWRANFGGEEKGEVEGDEELGDDVSNEEDGDDGDEDGGRKRKPPKATSKSALKKTATEKEKKKPAAPVMLVSSEASAGGVPEGRKRGRPRKILPPPVTLPSIASSLSDGSVQDEPVVSTPFTANTGTMAATTAAAAATVFASCLIMGQRRRMPNRQI